MSKRLVIVTGASRGIGRATALALAADHGLNVLALSRDEAGLDSLVKESRSEGRVAQLAGDISTAETQDAIVRSVGSDRLIGLVHNAGLLIKREVGGYTMEDLQQVYATNVFAPLLLTQRLAERLDGDPPGHVVHISSMGGFQDSAKFPGLAAYSSSKAALACTAQCLAEEFKERGIRSNALALGSVDTEMLAAAFPGYKAPTSAAEMGCFIARFVLEGHRMFNGKVLPVAVSTP